MQKKLCFFVLVLFSCIFIFPQPAFSSWSVSKHGGKNELVLTRMQQKTLARQMVNKFLRQGFFQNTELPHKTVLAKVDIKDADLGGDAKLVTDMILDALLENSRVVVQNQDFLTDLSLSQHYRLVSYDDEWICRRDGILLGADYIIVGAIESEFVTDLQGNVKKIFSGVIAVRNIRSNEVIAQDRVTLEKRKRSKH